MCKFSIDGRIADLQNRNAAIMQENREHRKQIEELSATALRAENERLRAENERLRAENKRLRAENERLRAENERLRAENERLRAENKRLRKELEMGTVKLREKINDLQSRLQSRLEKLSESKGTAAAEDGNNLIGGVNQRDLVIVGGSLIAAIAAIAVDFLHSIR